MYLQRECNLQYNKRKQIFMQKNNLLAKKDIKIKKHAKTLMACPENE